MNNRQAAGRFQINLAKWKRWSREFLPPDPTAGMQSGYSRAYNLDEAFTVLLGGHLVGKMKLSIPETRKALNILIPWMKEKGILPLDGYLKRVEGGRESSWTVSICNGPGISVKKITEAEIDTSYKGSGTKHRLTYIEEILGKNVFDPETARSLDLAIFVIRFFAMAGK